jgi:hypothetical protein
VDAFVDLPAALQLVVMLAIGLAVAALFSWLASRVLESDVRARTGATVATVLGVVAALYAVLVAFVIVNEWQTFDETSGHVSDEAATLAAIYYSARTLPEPARTDIQTQVLRYGRSVLCDELPRLRDDGRSSLRTRDEMERLFAEIAATHDRDPHSPFHDVMADQAAQLAGFRRDRIDAVGRAVPGLLITVIVASSVVLVAVASCLDTQHRRWHFVLTGAVTVVVALNLTVIFALDQPYRGAATVSDGPLRDGIPAKVVACGPVTTPSG